MDASIGIAITMDDGSLAIMSFCTVGRSPTLPVGATWMTDGSGRWSRPPTEANLDAEFAKAFPPFDRAGQPKPQPVSRTVVEQKDIPTDRAYRNAWIHDGVKIDHDIVKAREIHLDKIRQARTEALGVLDKDWMKAVGQGDAATAATVEAERQKLRDAPATVEVDKASTIEELKALWPAELPEPAPKIFTPRKF